MCLVRFFVKGHHVRIWYFFWREVPFCNEILALHRQYFKIKDHIACNLIPYLLQVCWKGRTVLGNLEYDMHETRCLLIEGR